MTSAAYTYVYPKLNDFLKLAYTIDSNPFPERDSVSFFTYLERTLTMNTKMFGHYTTRKSALASFGFSVAANDEKALRHAEEAKSRLTDVIIKLIDSQLKTIAFGSLLVKLNPKTVNDENKILIEKIFRPTEYDYDYPLVYIYKNGNKTNGYNIVNIEESNDYLFSEAEFLYRGGLLRSVMPLEILRYDMLLENANFLRKLKGMLQIINRGGTKEDQSAAEEAAANVIKDNFFISSEAIELKLNQITAAGSAAGFKDFIEWIDNSIAIAWLGQANTAELPRQAGSRAALQVQRMISADIFYADMNRVENFIDKLLLIDYRLNYNPKATPGDLPYRFRFNLDEEQDFEANASALDILRRTGIPLVKSEVYRKIGFKQPADGDEIMEFNNPPDFL